MIIDGHSHACGDFLNAASIIKKLDILGVDRVVLVPGEFNSAKNYSLVNIANVFPKKNVVKIKKSNRFYWCWTYCNGI